MAGDCDLLHDVGRRFIESGIETSLVHSIISDMRKIWGGDEVYIQAIDRSARDRIIRDGHKNGTPIKELAKKAGCTEKTAKKKIADSWDL